MMRFFYPPPLPFLPEKIEKTVKLLIRAFMVFHNIAAKELCHFLGEMFLLNYLLLSFPLGFKGFADTVCS